MRIARLASLALAAATLVLALAPGTAHACACCDGFTKRMPLGWSSAGDLLVNVHAITSCQLERAHEIWRPTAGDRTGCYDLLGDPDQVIACDQITTTVETTSKPKPAKHGRDFARAATPLAASLVRVQRQRLQRGEDQMRPSTQVTIDVNVKGVWRRLWIGAVQATDGSVDHPSRMAQYPLGVTVWPTPAGDRAAIFIENEDLNPGIGHWATTVHWAAMPQEPARVSPAAPARVSPAAPARVSPAAPAPRR